jgi:RNA polymerase sigma factor (sigma-70 family)
MTKMTTSPILRLIRHMAEDRRVRHLTDQELLRRFRSERDQAAFDSLLRRHGPMVLDVCRSVLGNDADAEDAFQATFLVLAQKAGAIRKQAAVGSWLHGVAYRTALKARVGCARRQQQEARAPGRPPPGAPDDFSWREVRQLLHAELGELSECYRAPLVLCYLEGKTRGEAATLLGVSKATVDKRLERSQALLRARLVRRGLGPAAVLAAAAWPAATATAHPPAVLVSSTARAAALFAAGQAATAGVTSARVVTLTQGVLQAMFLARLKVVTALLVLAGLLGCGVLVAGLALVPHAARAQQPARGNQEKTQAQEPPAAGQGGVKVMKPGKWVNSLAYCNDGKTVVVVIWNGTPRGDTQAGSVVLWDLEKGKVQQTLEEFVMLDNDTLQFWHATSSKDGTTVAASATKKRADFGAIRVWEAKTGKVLGTFEFSATVLGAVALSADGKKAAGGDCITGDGEVCVWDVPSGNLLQRLPTPQMENFALALSEDGKWIAAGGRAGADGANRDNRVMVWDLQTGKVKHEWTDPTMEGAVTAVAFSPDGKLVAAGGISEGSVRVWDVQTGKLKHLLKGDKGIHALAFSPDGKTLASAGDGGKIILWDVAKEKARVTLQGYDKDAKGRYPLVLGVAFAPDGRTMASGGSDGTMRFWPLAPAGGARRP